jgi:NAD(P) transhydrogenase subunit alpha
LAGASAAEILILTMIDHSDAPYGWSIMRVRWGWNRCRAWLSASLGKIRIHSFVESLGITMTEALIAGLVVFVLASFVGFEVINKVPPTLHTPLMSGANAISGIAIVGAILIAGGQNHSVVYGLGIIAVVFAMINVVGGFLVTDRMLQMFKK